MPRYRVFLAVILAALLFANATPSSAELVGFWSFDDENADDSSGNDNHGELVGVEFSDDVPFGDGLSLEITGGTYAQIPHSDSLDISDAMTIAFWMRAANELQTNNWNGPISKSGGEPRLGWELQRWEGTSRIDLRIDTDAAENSVRGNLTETYEDEWVHLAWTVEEGEVVSYLDGEFVEVSNYPHGDGFANPDVDLLIGCRGGQWCVFDGLIDEFGIWDEVLSEDAIGDLAEGISPIDPTTGLPGDYNNDRVVDDMDIDLLAEAMNSPNPDAKFDENNDGSVDADDHLIWVRDHAKTWLGDSNLDGEFATGDFVFVFGKGKYETGESAGWADGDWNGDQLFATSDFVAAFSDGGYEMGPRQATAAVPEPTTLSLLLLAMLLLPRRK